MDILSISITHVWSTKFSIRFGALRKAVYGITEKMFGCLGSGKLPKLVQNHDPGRNY